MKQLSQEIKNRSFQRVYLFFGEEKYLIRQYKDRLLQAVLGEDNGMNLTVFEGKNCVPEEMISQAQTMPFFAEYRLILIRDSGYFKKAPDEMPGYLEQIPETAILLFVEEEVDKRSRMYKQVKKCGRVTEFARQTKPVLKKWILGQLKKEKKQITERVLDLFLEECGDDMERISIELEKLFCYTLGRDTITAEDIHAVIVPSLSNRIFEMIDAIALHDRKRAMALYLDLIKLKESPVKILALIERQFKILLQLKSMREAGMGENAMASAVKIPPFAVKKNLSQASRFTAAQIQEALRICAEAEAGVKTGKLIDRMATELVMLSV